jgi:hypothetical protein
MYEQQGQEVYELWRLERALSRLARPVISVDDARSSPFMSDDLMALGAAGTIVFDRKELVQRLWSRKRLLLRRLGSDCDGPMAPVA